jgi:SAM-dependent methyltransferase
MTTAGKLVNEPLSKAQCSSCGLLQRIKVRHLGETEFYERSYSFYERPGANKYDLPRYSAMAEWIKSTLHTFYPSSILDVGCGRGWMMEAISKIYPNASIKGIEPSEQESDNARENGFPVITTKLNTQKDIRGEYDLVYSTNVIEHTTDPIDFLKSLKSLVNNDGFIVLTCPDSSYPNAEFMFSDQNYSFTPGQLIKIAKISGLHLVAWKSAPDVDTLKDKQLLVLSKSHNTSLNDSSEKYLPVNFEKLYFDRCRYVESYLKCDEYLSERVKCFENVYNFGTSTWSLLLAAYCPNYWKKVSRCVIDGGSGVFQGKVVVDFNHLEKSDHNVVVLGINPFTQSLFSQRFKSKNILFVCWNQIVIR